MGNNSENRQPNLVLLCIDRLDGGEAAGWAYTRTTEPPFSFVDTWDMLCQCNAFFDRLDYPQAEMTPHCFYRRPGRPAAGRPAPLPQDNWQELHGRVATLVLAVDTRRGATWQGRLRAPEGKEQPFNSELALYHILKTLPDGDVSDARKGEER